MKRVDTDPNEPEWKQGIDQMLRTVERLAGTPCIGCGAVICGHDAVASVVLGFQSAVRCAECFTRAFERGFEDLRTDLLRQIRPRPCYSAGWTWATRHESTASRPAASCLWCRKEEPVDV
jgi:hypothetical protein